MNLFNIDLSPLGIAPIQYLNQEGIIEDSGDYILPLGNRALISGGKRALAAILDPLIPSLEKSGISYEKHLFMGECSRENISTIQKQIIDFNARVLIGVGGGKSLDAAKAAAALFRIPVVCIPTIATTCASTTHLSVLYDQRGIFQRAIPLPRKPNLVIVDPKVIAHAPAIYLESGIMDSLAKWFEGNAVYKAIKTPDKYVSMAIQLSELTYKGFRLNAIPAVSSVRKHQVETPLIQVIHSIIFLTGIIQSLTKEIPFSGIAHAIHNGLTLLEGSHSLPHGIKVGYGILVQILIEKYSEQEFGEILSFLRELNLKPSLKGLHLPCNHDIIMKISEKAANDPYIGPVSYPITKEIIATAIEVLEKKTDPL